MKTWCNYCRKPVDETYQDTAANWVCGWCMLALWNKQMTIRLAEKFPREMGFECMTCPLLVTIVQHIGDEAPEGWKDVTGSNGRLLCPDCQKDKDILNGLRACIYDMGHL